MKMTLKQIWIDFDNSPHVPFFRPIIEELGKRNFSLILTARDAYQVSELTRLYNLECRTIGRHYGKNKFMKVLGLAIRSAQLLPLVLRAKPDLAVSHGSRAQVAVAKLLGIPSIGIIDYEYTNHTTIHPDWLFVPDIIPNKAVSKFAKRVLKYPGIKEDVYVPYFQRDPTILAELGVKENEILVTVRPPATEAHYHVAESELLFLEAMKHLCKTEGTRIALLPRNNRQKLEIEQHWQDYLQNGKIIIPRQAVEGLNLIWYSDLVISGGGTMNREAAALGVPVYSIFRGKMGAIDRYLSQSGRLVMLETIEDAQHKISLVKRNSSSEFKAGDRPALNVIVNGIITALES